MKNVKLENNRPLTIGLLANSVYLCMNGWEEVPDVIKGIVAGISISCCFIGIWKMNHDIENSPLYRWKQKMLRRG